MHVGSTDEPDPTPVAALNFHRGPITAIEWHPTDESSFVASSADDSVTLWDLALEADAEQEGVVITSLATGGVRNIPAVVHHGDVLAVPDTKQSTSFDHAGKDIYPHFRMCHTVLIPAHTAKRTTITHQYINEEWVCEEGIDLSTIVKYTQYRLVVSIAGYPLHNISGTAELLPAGCRVLQGESMMSS